LSSRLGPACLALGVILIGTAFLIAAIAGPTAENAPMPTPSVFSTGFAVWSTCGILGLLVGVIAARRARFVPADVRTASRGFEPATDAAATEPLTARLGAVLESVEGSA
jgi:hypothetical protein